MLPPMPPENAAKNITLFDDVNQCLFDVGSLLKNKAGAVFAGLDR